MRMGNHLKARQRGMQTGSSRLTNRPFITLWCAAFAVVVLYGPVGTLYQKASAAAARGGAAGFCSPGKIARFAAFGSGGDQDILPRNSLGRKTTTRYIYGTLFPDAACLGILPTSRNIKDLRDFDQIGSRDILQKIDAAGKMAVLHSPGLVHKGRDPNSVRAPPQVAVKCGHRSSDGSHHINEGRISTPSLPCPLFSRGAHCPLIFSSLYIRAPPMPTPRS